MSTQRAISMYFVTSLAAVAMAACNPSDNTTAGQKVDGVVADAKTATKNAANTISTGAADVAITTKVKSALAADTKLSALKINVDTKDGNVALTGTAPDASARDMASTLVNAVEGVRSVDNRLVVAANG